MFTFFLLLKLERTGKRQFELKNPNLIEKTPVPSEKSPFWTESYKTNFLDTFLFRFTFSLLSTPGRTKNSEFKWRKPRFDGENTISIGKTRFLTESLKNNTPNIFLYIFTSFWLFYNLFERKSPSSSESTPVRFEKQFFDRKFVVSNGKPKHWLYWNFIV